MKSRSVSPARIPLSSSCLTNCSTGSGIAGGPGPETSRRKAARPFSRTVAVVSSPVWGRSRIAPKIETGWTDVRPQQPPPQNVRGYGRDLPGEPSGAEPSVWAQSWLTVSIVAVFIIPGAAGGMTTRQNSAGTVWPAEVLRLQLRCIRPKSDDFSYRSLTTSATEVWRLQLRGVVRLRGCLGCD